MPEQEIRERGGAVRVRTQRLSGGRYRHIFVVRRAGPRGGHTVAGEVQRRKASAGHDGGRKSDRQPNYRIKPRNPKDALPARKR